MILVHGAFHAAWCWQRVLDGLLELGVGAVAIDLPGHGASTQPLGGLHHDAAHLRDVLRSCDDPVVLCGHSYGGVVITEAVAPGSNVEHLVYVTAGVPDVGESLADVWDE